MKHLILAAFFLLTACSGAEPKADSRDAVSFDADPSAAQKQMCIEEHYGVLRHSRAYLDEYCPSIKTQFELICFRLTHNTKDWRKACPGIDTADKLECMTVIQNGPSYALLESLQKCKSITNRKQIFCLSKSVAKTGVPLQPETVQDCIDKNL